MSRFDVYLLALLQPLAPPMKLPVLVLGASAALNAGLLAAFFAKPSLAPPSVRSFFDNAARSEGRTSTTSPRVSSAPSGSPAQPAARSAAAIASGKVSAAELWASLHSDDLTTLVARLRAAGFPASAIRAIVDAEIQKRFADRYAELRRMVDDVPYWRADPFRSMGLNTKFYETYSQLSRERMRLVREVLGKDAYAYGGVDPTEAQRRQFGNLSPGKIELVQRINDDYAEMISQVRASMQGITLPEDREKLALLEREKKADLAAILTPEELADYEMRSSTITMRLRTALTIMDASEAEFRSIYQAYLPHVETLFPTYPTAFRSMDGVDPRATALAKVQEQLTREFGPDRAAQFQRANDREFQQLYQLTRADNLPYDTVVRAYDTRSSASAASTKITEDPAMSPDDKRTALKNLAQQSRAQLLGTLGQQAGPTYVEAAQWLTYLEQGRSFTIMPTGGISTRSVSIPRPPVSAPKK